MRLKTALAVGLGQGVQRAPRALTGPLATVAAGFLFLAVERRVTLRNLARVYPEWPRPRRWKTAFGSYRQMARSLIEFLQSHRFTDADMIERVAMDEEDEATIGRALAEGRGVLLLTAHYGNWEWLARRMLANGYPLGILTKRPKDPDLDRRLGSLETFTPIYPGDTRGLVRWLKAGKVLGIVMDQEPARLEDGAVVPLLGRPTLTYVGPFRLARMTGALVLTTFVRRTGSGRYRVELEPFELSAEPDPDRALADDAARFNARLEALIRDEPDQWLWMYGRWRRLERMEAERAGRTEPS